MKSVHIYNAVDIAEFSTFGVNCSSEYLLSDGSLYNCRLEKFHRDGGTFLWVTPDATVGCSDSYYADQHFCASDISIIPVSYKFSNITYLAWNSSELSLYTSDIFYNEEYVQNILLTEVDIQDVQFYSSDRDYIAVLNHFKMVLLIFNQEMQSQCTVSDFECCQRGNPELCTRTASMYKIVENNLYVIYNNSFMCSTNLSGIKCGAIKQSMTYHEYNPDIIIKDFFVEHSGKNAALNIVFTNNAGRFVTVAENAVQDAVYNQTLMNFNDKIIVEKDNKIKFMFMDQVNEDMDTFLRNLQTMENLKIWYLEDTDTGVIKSSTNHSLPIIHEQNRRGVILAQNISHVLIDNQVVYVNSSNSKDYVSVKTFDRREKVLKKELKSCQDELKSVLIEKGQVQQSLHTCAIRQRQIKTNFEGQIDKTDRLIGERAQELVASRDLTTEQELKIAQLLDEIQHMTEGERNLKTKINDMEQRVLEYQYQIVKYENQAKDFGIFRAQRTCLDPLMFWSGYILAVLVVFFVCIFHVIRHQRLHQSRESESDHIEHMERIQISDIEHTHLNPNLHKPLPLTPDEQKKLLPQGDT